MSKTAQQRRETAARKLLDACTDQYITSPRVETALRTVLDRVGHGYVAFPVDTAGIAASIISEQHSGGVAAATDAVLEFGFTAAEVNDRLAAHPMVHAALVDIIAALVTGAGGDLIPDWDADRSYAQQNGR